MKPEHVPYNYRTRRPFNLGQIPLTKGVWDDRVVSVNIMYDKVTLSSTEDLALIMPSNCTCTHLTVEQAKSVLIKEDRIQVYRDVIKDFDDKITILRNPLRHPKVKKLPIPFLKLVFNGSAMSPVDIRLKLEELFPDDWRKLKLHSLEVAWDFCSVELDAINKGLYIQGPKKYKAVDTTRYFGTRRSRTSWCLYDKRAQLISRGHEDPGEPITRLELRNNIPAQERPYVEEWLAGRWLPYGLPKMTLLNTKERWDWLKDNEWAHIRRHGFQAILRSNTIVKHRKTKIKKIAVENQWIPLGYLAESVLASWARQYQVEYGLLVTYTGKFRKLLQTDHHSRRNKLPVGKHEILCTARVLPGKYRGIVDDKIISA